MIGTAKKDLSSIGFGTWAWGNQLLWGYEKEKSDHILKKTFLTAISGGLNFIDTADSYGSGLLNGRSESLLGQFVQELSTEKRKKLIIATKLAPFPWRLGRHGFKNALEASKSRLINHLDRVQIHWSTYRYAPFQEEMLLDGLDIYIRNITNLPVNISDDPLLSVVKGTGMVLENIKKYEKAGVLENT